jgi:TPP-dependent pyruvate/acetoin dehydrogenase alpha subunit
MGKVDQLVSSLQKLQSKRSVVDKQIAATEKKLADEVKAAAKSAAPAKKPAKKSAAKKATAKKPAAPKPPAK